MKSKVCRWIAGALVATTTIAGFAATASAQQGCQALWVERNSYYKDAGYCFKTRRAIAYFGNQGCIYYDEASVPLPPSIRARIADISSLERRYGCSW